VRDGDILGLDFELGETLEGNGFPVRGWRIKASGLLHLATAPNSAKGQDWDKPVALDESEDWQFLFFLKFLRDGSDLILVFVLARSASAAPAFPIRRPAPYRD
jgi:hypothetical protein